MVQYISHFTFIRVLLYFSNTRIFSSIFFHSVTPFILTETKPTKSLLPFVMGACLFNNFRYKFCGRNIIFFPRFFPRHIALNSFDTRTIVWSTFATAVLCYVTVVRSLVERYLIRIISGKFLRNLINFRVCFSEYFITFFFCSGLKYREFSSSSHYVLITLNILHSNIHDMKGDKLAVGTSALKLILYNRTLTYCIRTQNTDRITLCQGQSSR